MDSSISYNKAGFWSLVLGSSGQVRLRLEYFFFAAVPSWRGPEAAMKRFSGARGRHPALPLYVLLCPHTVTANDMVELTPFSGLPLGLK